MIEFASHNDAFQAGLIARPDLAALYAAATQRMEQAKADYEARAALDTRSLFDQQFGDHPLDQSEYDAAVEARAAIGVQITAAVGYIGPENF